MAADSFLFWRGGAYHYLSMPIRESSRRVTTDRVLAVSEPTSESILHL